MVSLSLFSSIGAGTTGVPGLIGMTEERGRVEAVGESGVWECGREEVKGGGIQSPGGC